MFQFLKKGLNRQNGYQAPNQQFSMYNQPYPNMYQPNQYANDQNITGMEINELKRCINDLNMRVSRLESYLGVRDSNQDL